MPAAIPSLGATSIHVGQIYDDPSFLFNTFGNNANESTRGVNFGGGNFTVWNGVTLTTLLANSNGISYTGTLADAVGSPGEYSYLGYTGMPGTGEDANQIANTGIHGSPTIQVTVTPGVTYSVDLLFANAFNSRVFDVFVEGQLYLDDLTLSMDAESYDRPLVYRFEFLATDTQMDISFDPGAEQPGYTDTNPYVNAIMVTQTVPEPSSALMGGLALLTVFRRKR